MNEPLDIDSIINEVLSEKTALTQSDIASRETSSERLPSIPWMVSADDSASLENVPTMVRVLYDNGSISYINLKTIPVIQRSIDDVYFLMWPDTVTGILLKPLYMFSRESDPIAYQRIEAYLASKMN